jgi:hypothetical protein
VGGLEGLSKLGLGCFRGLGVSSRRRCVVVICCSTNRKEKQEEGKRGLTEST